MVPQARDGSVFSPALRGRSGFTVGSKGDEQKFADFAQALAYLKAQTSACWRRPNGQGNWGIVTAVRWVELTAVTPRE